MKRASRIFRVAAGPVTPLALGSSVLPVGQNRAGGVTFMKEVSCQECFPLCPTSYLQAAFVLVESLAFPRGDSTRG